MEGDCHCRRERAREAIPACVWYRLCYYANVMQQGFAHSAHCLICARPARRGATLCAQCKSALRRARQTPNLQRGDLPHASVVRTDVRRCAERKSAHPRAARRASPVGPTPGLGGWGIYATIIAFGLAVCLTGYLAIGENERNTYLGRGAVTPVAQPVTREDGVAKADARVDTAAADTSDFTVVTEPYYEPVAEAHLAIFESLTPAPLGANPDRKAARAGNGKKYANPPPGAIAAGNASRPTPFPDATVLAGAAPAAWAEMVAPDRWQLLVGAQMRCEREGVITGLVCMERARLQYCDGEWGEAPQCPLAMLSLNTR